MPWGLSSLSPRFGTIIFALAFFTIRIGCDWLFRWFIADAPMPPLWTVLITTGIGTAISSVLVYLLLASVQRQFRAVRLLNHELRNSLQVLTYVASDLEPRLAAAARNSIVRLLQALGQASKLLARDPIGHNFQIQLAVAFEVVGWRGIRWQREGEDK
jgi:hypothetical protein